ncbi:MAG TPA: pyruvate, phosphate dikinase [Pyrinomonadaceae bacterium]|nr:pyruvate, phosphate dikinase [Pyrinomonadaceae bacterium]
MSQNQAHKWVYLFEEGDGGARSLLGGKGAGLADMTRAGLPVPPGFIVTTEACNAYYTSGKNFPEGMWEQVIEGLRAVEAKTGKKFGDPENPLLVSVRSGAPFSMPGMMDTVLNLGLNEQTVQGLAAQTGDLRFSLDAYRRFATLFGEIVMGVAHEKFERVMERYKAQTEGGRDTDLSPEQLSDIIKAQKQIIFSDQSGLGIPEDPYEQLRVAIAAVFNSWMGRRACDYRRVNRIPDDLGTAVNVQAMVFGNMGMESGTGVAFTRNPSTGEKKLYGEYLLNAQGEDVVAGIRTPNSISQLQEELPKAYEQFEQITGLLEKHYEDMQDVEFTIERGKLWMLQTRTGKRTGAAAVRVAVEMVREGLIDKATAVRRVTPEQLDQLLHPAVDPNTDAKVVAKGLPASPGAAQGKVVFDPDEAEELAAAGEKVVLVRQETSPDDFHGMVAAQAIVTARGGMTCVAGETKILTDRGMLTAEAAFRLLDEGGRLRILSFDTRELRPVWRSVIAAGRKPSEVISVAVSQTGHSERNVLRLTPDHKVFTVERRKLTKKRLDAALADGDFLTVVDQLPPLGEGTTTPELAYLAGAILSDGHVRVKPTKGSVTFVQKPTPAKADFIAAVEQSFESSFGTPFSYTRARETVATLRGREIRGSVEDRISFRRAPAAQLAGIRDNLSAWVLTLDRAGLLNFLAGYVDGDGTYAAESSKVRLQIVVSRRKPELLAGLVVACLRLGVLPQVTNNREAHLVQITERVDEILKHTRRVKADIPARRQGSKCFAVKALFDDIVEEVNFMGRVREAVKRNIMFDVEKLRRDVLPLCPGETYGEVEALLDSALRSYRVRQVGGPEPATVYNFEVEAESELDKNFVVFSSRLTPVLVSNSHAAVVARGMGKSCVCGASVLNIDYSQQQFNVNGTVVPKGEWITVDGSTGRVFLGQVPTIQPTLDDDFRELMSWADEFRRLRVRANADTPHDAQVARDFGAEGIGLCRTEHMFFGDERLAAMREMILADGVGAREKALERLLPLQKNDFVGIFRAMKGLPVTIRLLDPPLHEFLPNMEELMAELSELKLSLQRAGSIREMDRTLDSIDGKRKLLGQVERLREANPMLGHRGCRLGLIYPEVTRMQVRAIFEAACQVAGEGLDVKPEIMVPLVSTAEELRNQAELINEVAREVLGEHGMSIEYTVGTMIELPRAALTADRIAEYADFFSFGTNDLTQTTFGLSRDDSGRFLSKYVEVKILPDDPFQVLDREGVGQLVRLGTERGRSVKPNLKVGICGEHGGEPRSIAFCHLTGLDYVSCSPFRVPVARLASAQAALEMEDGAADK